MLGLATLPGHAAHRWQASRALLGIDKTNGPGQQVLGCKPGLSKGGKVRRYAARLAATDQTLLLAAGMAWGWCGTPGTLGSLPFSQFRCRRLCASSALAKCINHCR